MALRQYQKDTLNNIIRSQRKGNKNILLQAATGSGKTVMASAFVNHSIKQNKSVLFLAHRRELITQCSDKLEQEGIRHGIIMAGEPPQFWHNTQVASIDTLRSRTITNKTDELPKADLIIIDEAHRCLSNTYLKIIDMYKESQVLGLTATPIRSDGRGLGNIFSDMVQAPSIRELINQGHLVGCEYFAPTIPDLNGIQTSMGDYNSVQLADRMDHPKLIGDIVSSWKKIANNKKTIVFASSVAHSKNLAESFIDIGVRAAHIDGTTDHAERERVLNEFNNGDMKIICNCMVLTEGFDCPPAEVCVLARPTKSLGMYIQMVGRVLRPYEGKTHATIIDHSGAVYTHGFVEDDIEWHLDPKRPMTIKERKLAKPKEEAQIICEGCFSMFSGSNICSKCGHIQLKKSKYVAVLDKELGFVDKETKTVKKKLTYAPEFRKEFYKMLLGYCKIHNYNSRWAYHTYKTRFNESPLNYRKAIAIKPSSECSSYIRHLQIKKRKSNHK
jgi:superfamily II DNA or RNA helicase